MTQLKYQSKVERREGKHVAMLMLNLGDVEALSDGFSSNVESEQLSRQIKHCIRQQLRDSDSVAQLDNNNFVVLLESIHSPENAEKLANALIKDLSESLNLTLEHENQLDLSVQVDFVHQE
jgi:GGDEF domain-containing protein